MTTCSPAAFSSRIYVRLAPADTRLFRYLLEACDNLAYTTVIDRKGCILKVVFPPALNQELYTTLHAMRRTCPFALLEVPETRPFSRDHPAG
jgi:hypothetical protein